MDSLTASLEAEQRSKTEALRIKKKLESDINELEIALDHANKANAEGQKAIKRYQGTLRDTIQAYEDETRQRQQIMESVGISERKANALSGEVSRDQRESRNCSFPYIVIIIIICGYSNDKFD